MSGEQYDYDYNLERVYTCNLILLACTNAVDIPKTSVKSG